MIASILLLAFSLSAGEAPPAALTADLDGQGDLETVVAAVSGAKVRLVIRDSRGKLLAESFVPAPGPANPRVAITAGSLASAGALVEAFAASADMECRSLWRYRDGRLSQTPVLGSAGPLPACGPPEWSYRWERPSEEAPAVYTRERSRQRPNGLFREVEAFRYAGFRLEPDTQRSSAWINGVEIPAWRDAVLYDRAALEQLSLRFDLSPFQSQPRLRVRADRSEGTFELRIEEASTPARYPVTAASPGERKGIVLLTAGTQGIRVRLLLSAEGSVPLEAVVHGLGARLDHVYVPVTQRRQDGLRVYDSAEQELAEDLLPGTWDGGKERLDVKLVSSSPVLLRFGNSDVSLSVARAPHGVDVLLLPKDGSLPTRGILLRGTDSLLEVPVHCAASSEADTWRCESGGPGRTLRRVGARLNVR